MVALATDCVPDGLLGALERIGLKPLSDPRLYGRLAEIYMRPDQRHAANALRHVGAITATMLRIIDILPPELLCSATLKKLESSSDAAEFVDAIQLAQAVNSRATDEVVREMLGRLGDDAHLTSVVTRLIRRADVELEQSLAADNQVAPIRTVRDMIWTGRRLRNCLSTNPKIVSALAGRRAYALFRDTVVLEFAPLSDGRWLYLEPNGFGNAPVGEDASRRRARRSLPRALAASLRQSLAAGGSPFHGPWRLVIRADRDLMKTTP